MVSDLLPAPAVEHIEENLAEQAHELLGAYYRAEDIEGEPPSEEECLTAVRDEKAQLEEKLVANEMPVEMAEVYALQSIMGNLQVIGTVVPITELMDVSEGGPQRPGPGFQ